MPTPQEEFNNFVNTYKKTQVSGEDAGLLICRLTQYYADANSTLVSKEEKLNKRYVEIANSQDESTLKSISMAKCDALVKDTNEYREAAIAKVSLQNIEMYINSLKILQKGILSEQNFSGGL